MKKTVILLLFCLTAMAAHAAVVPQERAASVAASFFGENAATKSAGPVSVRLVACYPDIPTKSAATAPAIYVFEQETEGFVLVAGDDAARPVLGYSLTGHFRPDEPLPVNCQDLLDWYVAEIDFARQRGWKPSASIRALWDQPASVSTKALVKLTTAEWNQGSPYNDLCPRVDGQECPCGCVATAMAIIMRYHSWPKQGTGTLPSYDFGWDYEKNDYRYHVEGFDLGHTYDWDKMSLTGSFSEDGKAQVARLCYDLGVMSWMDYDPSGSGAASDSPIPLATYFGYDKQMRYYDRSYYSDERWEELIRDEIDAGRPVFHCGSSSRGGHAFVLDGYNDERYFSINYGWGGYMNAYYTMTPIEGHAADLTEFNQWQDMVCRIMPDQGGTPYVNVYVSGGYAPFSWDFRAPTFRSGEFSLYKMRSTGDGPTELAFCLFDKDGKLKEALSEPFVVDGGKWPLRVPSVECKAPSQVADGDRILMARKDDKYQWTSLSQERFCYLQFDGKRRLSEMVSLGHTYGYASKWDFGLPSCLVLRTYKDIYWEIRRASDGKVLVDSGEQSVHGQSFSYFYDPLTRDARPGRCDFQFWLPAGEYEVFFRNFDEEMTLRVTL
jgi:hypothetical protein